MKNGYLYKLYIIYNMHITLKSFMVNVKVYK